MLNPSLVWLAALAILAAVAVVELSMGREPMCTCGRVTLWHGVVNSPENSQQVSDWYTFTHVLHGILFYGLLTLVAARLPVRARLLLAMLFEGAWEIVENSPFIIDRYRANTLSLDYYGDSVINSVADIVAMAVGFWLARRLPLWATVATVVLVEVSLVFAIRDNLTLNILMLIHPIDAIKRWQLGV